MESIDHAWNALHLHLLARAQALADEVRHYPGPIARCDEHLPQLIADRAEATALARDAESLEAGRTGPDRARWERELRGFAARLPCRDAIAAALRDDLLRGLGAK